MNQIYEQYSQDPDETFKMYVDRLMKAKPKFGGTFVNPPQGQGQQGQDATSRASGGLLTGLFPEYADRMGGGGGDSGMPSVNSGSAPSSFNPRGNFASAESVLGSQQFAQDLSGMGRSLGQVGNAILGPAGMLLGLAPRAAEYYSNRQWDSFNRGIDSDAAARAEAMSLGGMGTYSDQQGNLGTISNQALIDAYDREVFGVTGANLDSERNPSAPVSYDFAYAGDNSGGNGGGYADSYGSSSYGGEAYGDNPAGTY
jgi:hypothetical protein